MTGHRSAAVLQSSVRSTTRFAICTLAVAAGIAGTAIAPRADCGDVNQDGKVTTSDALGVLRKSVGQDVALVCDGECAGTNAPGTHRHTIAVEGSDREFIVYVPQLAAGETSAPVVFMFHGTSGDGERFYNISRWREKADETGLIAVFPTALVYCFREDENFDGDFDDPGEFKVTTKWAAGKLGDEDKLPLCSEEEVAQLPQPQRELADHPLRDDVAFVDAMLDFVAANYGVDAARFYATGFSNGAAMTARLTTERANRFAASASAAGGFQIPNPAPAALPISAVLSIGEVDEGIAHAITGGPAIPLNEDIMTNPVFRQGFLDPFLHVLGLPDSYAYEEQTVAGAKVLRFVFEAESPQDGNVLEFLLIEGLGHSYPNGTNHPIVIANYLWEFFRDRTLGG